MNAYAINESLCVECGQCRRFCPVKGAIIIDERYQHVVLADSCTGCGICEAFCPVPGALFQMMETSPKPLKILRRVIWRRKWGFHNHPLMGAITLRARAALQNARRQERYQFATG